MRERRMRRPSKRGEVKGLFWSVENKRKVVRIYSHLEHIKSLRRKEVVGVLVVGVLVLVESKHLFVSPVTAEKPRIPIPTHLINPLTLGSNFPMSGF